MLGGHVPPLVSSFFRACDQSCLSDQQPAILGELQNIAAEARVTRVEDPTVLLALDHAAEGLGNVVILDRHQLVYLHLRG